MSLFEQINRIKTIKTNILNAIAGKGVTVPTDTKLEDTPTLIEQISGGGGSEEWHFDNARYLFYSRGDDNVFVNNIVNHIYQPRYCQYMVAENTYSDGNVTPENFQKIMTIDMSKATHLQYAFANNAPADSNEQTYNYAIDLSSCTNLNNAFRYWLRSTSTCNSYVSLDFQGTTSKVTDFGNTFYTNIPGGYYNVIKEVLNINMDKATTVSSVLGYVKNMERLTFSGSFGGNSTTSSLTLDLSTCTSLTKEAIIETFTTLSENTNAKTRIIKLAQTIYESLTEDEIAIATNKGYTVSY